MLKSRIDSFFCVLCVSTNRLSCVGSYCRQCRRLQTPTKFESPRVAFIIAHVYGLVLILGPQLSDLHHQDSVVRCNPFMEAPLHCWKAPLSLSLSLSPTSPLSFSLSSFLGLSLSLSGSPSKQFICNRRVCQQLPQQERQRAREREREREWERDRERARESEREIESEREGEREGEIPSEGESVGGIERAREKAGNCASKRERETHSGSGCCSR